MLAIFNQLPTGAHAKNTKGIEMVQCRNCTMELSGPGVVNIDGKSSRGAFFAAEPS